jgi:hypothetical protein
MSSQALKNLHKELLKAASAFKDNNFRQYFNRIVEDDFAQFSKAPKVTEAEFMSKQQANLEVLQRQAPIQNMYFSDSFAVRR